MSKIILGEIEKKPNIGRVLFNHKIVAIEQQENAMAVTVEAADKETKQFRSSYVVGADGGRSTTRRLLGVSFEGSTWPRQLVATNVVYPFDKHGYNSTNLIWCNIHPNLEFWRKC